MNDDVITINRWMRCGEMISYHELEYSLKDTIILKNKRGMLLGSFESIEQLYFFLLGYNSK